MTECPEVSVLMPVANPECKFFKTAVNSILAQTLKRLELFIIGPRPAAYYLSVCQELADDRVRVITTSENATLATLRNEGLKASRTELVAMMDADDIAHRTRLDRQREFLERHPNVAIVGSQIATVDASNCVIGYRRFPVEHDDIVRAMASVVPLCQSAVMLRREVIMQAGGYSCGKYMVAEDYELWSRLVQRGVRFANLPHVLLRYRLHDNQLKRRHLRETILAVLDIKDSYWRHRMEMRAYIRMWMERCVLVLPEVIIAWLVVNMLYRDSMGRPEAASEDMSEWIS